MEDSASAATLVFENDLIRSEIVKQFDRWPDELELKACALTSKAAFRTAVMILWEEVSLAQDRLEHYLRAIRQLNVPERSLLGDDSDFPPDLLVIMGPGEHPCSQPGDIKLSLDLEGCRSERYFLSGCEHLPNVLRLDVEPGALNLCRDFGDMGMMLRCGEYIDVHFAEIHDLGDRSVSTSVHIDNDRLLDWQQPTMSLGEASRLDSLWIRDSSDGVRDSLLSEVKQLEEKPDHRTRLYQMRYLTIESGMAFQDLSAMLALLSGITGSPIESGGHSIITADDRLILKKWITSGDHNLESILLEHGDLDWLPHIYECREVDLYCHGPPVISPSYRESTTQANTSKDRDNRKLESLGVYIPDLKADSDAEVIISFIQAYINPKTWVVVVVPGVEKEQEDSDSDSSGSGSDDVPGTEWMDHIRQSVAYLKEKEGVSAEAAA